MIIRKIEFSDNLKDFPPLDYYVYDIIYVIVKWKVPPTMTIEDDYHLEGQAVANLEILMKGEESTNAQELHKIDDTLLEEGYVLGWCAINSENKDIKIKVEHKAKSLTKKLIESAIKEINNFT